MAIKHWPEGERPREKLLARGPQALSDAELLAIFIVNGTQGKTAIDIARNALDSTGSLSALLNSPPRAIRTLPGIGPAKFITLQAALELASRYYAEATLNDDIFTNPAAARRFLVSRLNHRPREVFGCMFLNNRHRMIEFQELFLGTIDSATIHPREVVKHALSVNAAAVIFAHNHPSGDPQPSRQDRDITQQLKEALALVDIRVLDHIIVGQGQSTSMAELGWI